MIVPDKDKRIIRFIFSEANFCLGSNPFPEKKDEKIFFSSGMMMVRSIVRGDCPCILQLFSSETIASCSRHRGEGMMPSVTKTKSNVIYSSYHFYRVFFFPPNKKLF